jgi:hypothetical protein
VNTYFDFDRELHRGSYREGEPIERRKIANNTYAERRGDDIAVRLHATDILTYHPDETVTFDTGGWFTVTTKARFNDYAPSGVRFYSVKGVWYVSQYGQQLGVYTDGLTLPTAGDIDPWDADPATADALAKDEATKRDIERYLRGLTPERWAEVVEYARSHEVLGDCLYCQIEFAGKKAGTEEPAGWLGTDHLESHLEEPYYMVTLAGNALRFAGYGDMQLPVVVAYLDIVKRALRRYLRARLLEGPDSGNTRAA